MYRTYQLTVPREWNRKGSSLSLRSYSSTAFEVLWSKSSTAEHQVLERKKAKILVWENGPKQFASQVSFMLRSVQIDLAGKKIVFDSLFWRSKGQFCVSHIKEVHRCSILRAARAPQKIACISRPRNATSAKFVILEHFGTPISSNYQGTTFLLIC